MNFPARWKQIEANGFVERRVQPRFPSEGGSFAFLSLTEMVGGQIQDINEHGLSFRYVASRQKLQGQCLVDIKRRDGGSHCHRLPCRVAWDRAEPNEFFPGPFTIRVCGVQFGELTVEQKANVEAFVHRNEVKRTPCYLLDSLST
jgi:hypothetical protein